MAFLSLLQGQSARVRDPKVKIKEIKKTIHPVHGYQFKQSTRRLSRESEHARNTVAELCLDQLLAARQ
jgi:uncharacterized protein YhbP (UPF0306 family)